MIDKEAERERDMEIFRDYLGTMSKEDEESFKIKLLPCPLCGSTNVEYDGYCVDCNDCPVALMCDPKVWNKLPRKLHWTETPPTQEGIYWWKRNHGEPVIRKIQSFNGELGIATDDDYWLPLRLHGGGEWSDAPIELPEEPVTYYSTNDNIANSNDLTHDELNKVQKMIEKDKGNVKPKKTAKELNGLLGK